MHRMCSDVTSESRRERFESSSSLGLRDWTVPSSSRSQLDRRLIVRVFVHDFPRKGEGRLCSA